MSHKRENDKVTGVETTGHVWDDDIRELNNPLPKWWLYTFYACCLWAFAYWVLYPAWPTLNGYTKGTLGYSQRATVASEIVAARQGQDTFRRQMDTTPLGDVRKNADLFRFATASGAAAFQTNCAPCHGRGAQGFIGYPNLNDDKWIWGGGIDEIYRTIQFGIRSDHKDARFSQMPRYGVESLLKADEIESAAEYVLSLTKQSTNAVAAKNGAKIFSEQCAACHGADGGGNVEFGAPSLSDGIWLYGGSKDAIIESISTGRGGAMPAWINRLDAPTIKSLAVYVHSLGGGK
jgi:cytochrome c oxidase cbb3-type subunit III